MCVWKESVHRKKLVRSKPLKNIIHMVNVGKRYEKASEKLTPRGPLSPFYYSRLLWCCRKRERERLGSEVGVVEFSHSDFSSFFSRPKFLFRKKDKIYGNFPSVETAFLRHYALWQYFVMTSFSDGLLKAPRDRENGLKITATAALLFLRLFFCRS
jgi:hypothetical protein